MKQVLSFLVLLVLFSAPAWGASLTLTWTDNSDNEDGFRIHRKTGIAGDWGNIQNVGANVTTWTDTVPENQQFCYRVKAFRAGIEDSGFSNEACGTAVIQEAPLGIPTVLKFQVGLTCTLESVSANTWIITCPAVQ